MSTTGDCPLNLTTEVPYLGVLIGCAIQQLLTECLSELRTYSYFTEKKHFAPQ